MRMLRLVFPLVLGLVASCNGAGKPDESPCQSDAECASGYCECVSACRSGCCRQRPAEPIVCTQDCTDLRCGASRQLSAR